MYLVVSAGIFGRTVHEARHQVVVTNNKLYSTFMFVN